MTKITVLINKNNSEYVNWQAELLYYSFLRYHKNDDNMEFIAVVIDDNKPVICDYPYYLCKNKSKADIVPKDNYIIFDRAFSIKEFLENTKSKEERLFLFIESDFLFLKPFHINSENFLGQKYLYMDQKNEFCSKVINYYMSKINPSFKDFKNYYRPVGWPFLIKENVLNSIIDRWIELNIKFRSEDPGSNPLYKNWICDMFGFNIAIAEKMIIPEVVDIMQMPPFDTNKDSIFCHYCYGIKDNEKEVFDKRTYKPWTLIDCSDNLGENSKKLICSINNYIKENKK